MPDPPISNSFLGEIEQINSQLITVITAINNPICEYHVRLPALGKHHKFHFDRQSLGARPSDYDHVESKRHLVYHLIP